MADYKTPGVYVEHVPSGSAPISGAGTSTAGFVGVFQSTIAGVEVPNPAFDPAQPESETNKKLIPKPMPAVGAVKLITNFTEFKDAFGDFSNDSANPGHSILAHAVYGFFLNGGTRCYVTRTTPPTSGDPPVVGDWTNTDIADALALFEPIEEITIVAAPGLSGANAYTKIAAHCNKVETCVAVLDTKETIPDYATDLGDGKPILPQDSSYTALYFPWIKVYDPATKAPKFVPPSGYMAGIYARVDAQRGVHKAPANETVLGALDVKYAVSHAKQEGLNPHGVNCIRWMNGSIKVWGARTVGGDANTEFMYLNVRRVFNFLRQSIDQGTQWAVFEPNDPDLWAKITRNVSAFLTIVWNSGALFGSKAEEAFYVKCDAETNPPSLRDLGQVVTEIGVAITRPAEFVIFRLGQKAAS